MCDHRVKGHAYCQDCIVRGVEMLQSGGPAGQTPSGRSRLSPVLAALAGLIPGLGAVYNKQNVKAFAHFILTVGLFEIADLTRLSLFGVGGVVFYLYSIIDAYRTAQAIQHGLNPSEQDERWRTFMQENVRTWAGILIALGIIFFVTDIFRLSGSFMSLSMLLPVAFIGLAVYLLLRPRRPGKTDDMADLKSYRPMTPTMFTPPTGRLTGPVDPAERTAWSDYADWRKR
jgi:TM2 domain-containing membrane protein YozV